jgi:hypothetical protein
MVGESNANLEMSWLMLRSEIRPCVNEFSINFGWATSFFLFNLTTPQICRHTSPIWYDIRKITSHRGERNTTVCPDLEVRETTTKMDPTPHLAPPSKLLAGILATAIRNDVLERNS